MAQVPGKRARGCGSMYVALGLAVAAATASGQTLWTSSQLPLGRLDHAMAPDSARARLLCFGGSTVDANWGAAETWAWNGATWQRLAPANAPSARHAHAMTEDRARGRVVLFGGDSYSGLLGDTWEWDGSNWLRQNPATSPAARRLASMTWDQVRGRVVLFGGERDTSSNRFNDTWEWDGTNWQQRSPAHSPPLATWASMAYDPVLGRTVLFRTGLYFSERETWEWDGTDWTLRQPATLPPGRSGQAMAFDAARGRVVMFGGWGGQTTGGGNDPLYLRDTWEWDGNAWIAGPSGSAPTGRTLAVMAPQPVSGRVLLFGGTDSSGLRADAWEWNGTQWSLRGETAPAARAGHAMATDFGRGRVVLFGGNGYNTNKPADTWEWDGATWREQVTPLAPMPRSAHAMTQDVVAGRVVLFGGLAAGSARNDTWTWDGTVWNQMTPASSPAPRYAHTMAYDESRRRVVLFGGEGADFRFLADTWEWDGGTWRMMTPAHAPAARMGYCMAFDPVGHRVLLFGGTSPAELWAWDGSDWARVSFTRSPPGVAGHARATDPFRQRIVVFGGDTFSSDQTWEWDGSDWRQRFPVPAPSRLTGSAMAFDPVQGRMVLFGGYSSSFVVREETWQYFPVWPASSAPFGAGCAGSSGTPTLTAGLPWLGEVFTLAVAPVPPPGAALMWLGVSNSTWGGLPLPLDLTPFGMPGCSLLVSLDVGNLMAGTGATRHLDLTLAQDPVLLGARVFGQAFVYEPAVGPVPLVDSNGVAAQMGAK